METKWDAIVNGSIVYAKKHCDELEISKELPRRQRKKKHIFGDGSRDAGLPYSEEIRKAMFSSLDRLSSETNTRFKRLLEVNEKYGCLIPAKLLNPACALSMESVPDNINRDEFIIERKR